MKQKTKRSKKTVFILIGIIIILMLCSGSVVAQTKRIHPNFEYLNCGELQSYFDAATTQSQKELLIMLISRKYDMEITMAYAIIIPDSTISVSTNIDEIVNILLKPDKITVFEVVTADDENPTNIDLYYKLGKKIKVLDNDECVKLNNIFLHKASSYLDDGTRYSCEHIPGIAFELTQKGKKLLITISKCDHTFSVIYNNTTYFERIYPNALNEFVKELQTD